MRANMSGGGAGEREREIEREIEKDSPSDSTLSVEPAAGLDLTEVTA